MLRVPMKLPIPVNTATVTTAMVAAVLGGSLLFATCGVGARPVLGSAPVATDSPDQSSEVLSSSAVRRPTHRAVAKPSTSAHSSATPTPTPGPAGPASRASTSQQHAVAPTTPKRTSTGKSPSPTPTNSSSRVCLVPGLLCGPAHPSPSPTK